ncbi:hypothetical protein [Salinibacter ruber]|uniref:hypothetical protein n=1 Tax=Salinibacter ruber TaxID=146919 RepID=UPI00216A849F|nr:hypothetical protein [Salinibacter ruber]MCS3613385.1 hypothetical protein [Salinibacter ruber]
MSNELPQDKNGELTSRDQRSLDRAERGFHELGKTIRSGISEHQFTIREKERLQHEKRMEGLELKKRRLNKEERSNIRENATERENAILQSDLSEESKLELLQRSRSLMEKSLEMTRESSSDERTEVKLTNQSRDE